MFSYENLGQTFSIMDKDQICVLSGLTLFALGIGAFIIWGPNSSPARRGGVIGLQNLGLTCFLNTLLQAMASCAIFVEWLESCHGQGPVASALYYLLKVLSTEPAKLPEGIEEPLAPSGFIQALRGHGWSIGFGEQDAHELFHLIMATLEEEAHKTSANEGSLTDALEPKRRNSTGDVEESHKSSGDKGEPQSLPPVLKFLSYRLVNKQGEPITRKILPKYDSNKNCQASPFCGLLTSQLQCVDCGFKSVVRYDKFDSLSLHLPEMGSGFLQPITLAHLLDRFTQTESVNGVVCEGCNNNRAPDQPPITTTSLKTLSIGKLPRCLCIHIHRISMDKHGSPYKRPDYVDFPEYLCMDPYTQNSIIKEQKLKEDVKPDGDETAECSTPKSLPCRMGSYNHIYRVKAVVVHRGSVHNGHFVTYRRGPLQSSTRHRSDRWYLTSDESVTSATLAGAMEANAYMLFYEKCSMTPT
ncbi:ubiquitin carboxyl-terminal hydrolase 30 homolog isoform X1 [Macrosteles quadrilineatus]|uniref:ubiquitin carboxyl-terminal hydrolase 30 homolog isoform X1 n=1 Tax=Macrosteles quadrilineatus TaxID=74068 RepID=UPI0023E0DB3D|nr:ubiquitin carboxyl-terminal hydrolase 30 homolog isoform X1 [Macrosteles quadrilineatus]XP_054290809.1 ubiquitin carboxyl-terminal hydrolase 30 homolog isoform X1 [Macrosteles quadrilineatus]